MNNIIMERLRLYEQHNYGESVLKVDYSRRIPCHTDELHCSRLFHWGGNPTDIPQADFAMLVASVPYVL